ncbi:GNAT family protein [Arthrobacter sp. Soc17.1.1.1]|uniref:GNAT family N-acetyltransferase n=1 Tax=Arthrobacter sp. Soc17.1.1.1 TaxID=3121277 RepID=UPI002FE46125
MTSFPATRWPVRTERLALRPAAVADLPSVFAYRRLAAVSEWLPTHPSDEHAFVERLRQPERLAATYVLELGGTLIGDLYLAVEDAVAQVEVTARARATTAEIGWALDPAFTGQGYATEAAAELLRLAFEDLGVRRVVAQCFADNTPSWRLMERLGMRRESSTRAASLHRSGRWLDGVGYGILAEEWRRRADA